MATIIPQELPAIDPSLHDLMDEHGPGFVDQRTAVMLIQRANAGWIFVPVEAERALLEIEQSTLDALFAAELTVSPLKSADPFDHRVFALAKVLKMMGDRVDKNQDPASGAANPLRREALDEATRGTVAYRDALHADLIGIGLTPTAAREVIDLLPVTARRAASMTGLSEGTLAVWRQRGQGPVFMTASAGTAKAGPRGRVVYPLGELLQWLYGQGQG